jgi:replicative DNA helicase
MSAENQFQVLSRESAQSGPPRSSEVEEQVLAACLVDGCETIGRALQAGVTVKAFFDPKNARIWETMVDLFRAKPPVTVDVLAAELTTRKLFEECGGFPYLMQVTGKVPTTAHAGFFIDKLLELSALRLAERIALSLREKVHTYAGGRLDEFFAKELSALSAAIRHSRRGVGLTMAEQIDAVVAEATAAQAGTLDSSGWVSTGLPAFDERCRPFGCQRSDHFIVDAAGSGIGKSAFMRQVAGHALERGQRVRFYTREDGIEGCIELMAASRAGVDLDQRAGWTKDMLVKFTTECHRLRELAGKRLWCVENTTATPMLTIEQLEEDARYFAATQGAPHLWVVDYLQIFGTKKRCTSREQEMAHVSHQMQGLCRELGGVWLVGCQMNEAGLAEMRTLRRDDEGKVIHRLPSRGDLRESQAIYHDADRVIAHYLPPVDSRDSDQTGPNILQPEVWLCQIKRRKGRTGVVKCWFEKRFTRFVEVQGGSHGTAAEAAPGGGGGFTKKQFKGEK